MAVLSELGGIFTLKKEQITAQEPFVGEEDEIFRAGSGGSLAQRTAQKQKKKTCLHCSTSARLVQLFYSLVIWSIWRKPVNAHIVSHHFYMQDPVLLLPPSQDTLWSAPLDPRSFSIYLLSHRRFWTGLCLNVPCSEHCTEKRQKKLFLLVLTHKVWTLNFPPVIALLLYEKKNNNNNYQMGKSHDFNKVGQGSIWRVR